MKKLLILLAFISCTTVIYAQEPTTADQIDQVVNNVVDKATVVISQLADALKVPAEHVYSILVRQQIVIGISSIMFAILMGVVFFFSAKWANKDDWDEFLPRFICIISGIMFTISFLLFVIDGLPGLLNPEYGAIKDILDLL